MKAKRELADRSNTRLERRLKHFVDFYEAPEAVKKTYAASYLVNCTLPHSDPGGELRIWSRESGNERLIIYPYIDSVTQKSMYPYGVIPRLLLYWMTTEVVLTEGRLKALERESGKPQMRDRRIYLGDSWNEFIEKLQLTDHRKPSKQRLLSQMSRLLGAAIVLENSKATASTKMFVAENTELWWSPNGETQGAFFQSNIELGAKFYASLLDNPSPVDYRHLLMLKGSPLDLDIYGWIVRKTWQANQDAKTGLAPLPTTWQRLYEQMGAEYTTLKNFRQKVRASLKRVKRVYRECRVQDGRKEIYVLPAALPIPEKTRKVIIQSTIQTTPR